VSLPTYTDVCPIFHGTLYEGIECNVQGVDGLPGDAETVACGPGLWCLGGRCRDPRTVSFGDEGEPCELSGACNGELVCNELLGICMRIPVAGEPCLQGGCAEGFFCDGELCQAPPGPGEQCPLGICTEDAICDAGICRAIPGEGQRCLLSTCAEGLVCDTADDTCRRLPGAGQPCVNGQCVEGARCVFDVMGIGVCEPLAGNGQPCMGHGDCVSEFCPNGFCAVRGSEGDPCTPDAPCETDLFCQDGRCVGIGGPDLDPEDPPPPGLDTRAPLCQALLPMDLEPPPDFPQ
jgi:hypothetical protein